ncbi:MULTISPECIES: NmrA/HSCARG family protein [unclassified Rhizobium]|uniref:NmrA/HSCARG family protein n=1 Tax=unclassified Rhizobium TaxID=2613769 RepID=UPI0021F7ECF6|nr:MULTISPECIES: NmrA/HSCARG family protein [unclassified Rhizobium]MCV9941294.1 NmrA/HSCARG family protein [Rhizobium sp. BT-175]MCW0016753.1 NmrA/HSCARG family protein [Rhizobium sp. BT-226]
MSNTPEFLVFGATGQQGGAVTRALREAGREVRAFVRDPYSEKAKSLAADGVSLVAGDLFDRVSIDRAMTGIRGVFSVQTSSPSGLVTDEQEVDQGKSIADSALSNGVAHLVYSSTGAAGKGHTGMGHFDTKSRIEDYVRSLPIATTITRPASFMEMMMLPGMGLNTGVFTYFMQPDQSMQMIALHDLGRINAQILCQPDLHAGRVIELSGQDITGKDLQEAFSRAAGRPIHYQRFSEELLSENNFLKRLTALVDNGVVAGIADIAALEREFGPMLRVEQWLSGPGKTLFENALSAEPSGIGLR